MSKNLSIIFILLASFVIASENYTEPFKEFIVSKSNIIKYKIFLQNPHSFLRHKEYFIYEINNITNKIRIDILNEKTFMFTGGEEGDVAQWCELFPTDKIGIYKLSINSSLDDSSHLIDTIREKAFEIKDIFYSIYRNDKRRFNRQLSKLTNMNIYNLRGETLLNCCISERFPQNDSYFINEILSNGPNLNLTNKNDGRTPIMEAIWDGEINLINYLVGKNVNIDIKDTQGNTVLHWAARKGNEFIIKKYVNDYRKEIKNLKGQRPIDFARFKKNNGHSYLYPYLE